MKNYSPITQPQKRILDAEQIAYEPGMHTIRTVYTYSGYDPVLIYNLLVNLVSGFEDLNTRFNTAYDGIDVLSYIGDPAPERVRLLDEGDTEWKIKYGFDSGFAPFWDAPLYDFFVQKNGGDTDVFLKIHHSITDGTGVSRIGAIIYDALPGFEEQKEIKPIPAVYGGYRAFENNYFASEAFSADRQYWENSIDATYDYPDSISDGNIACSDFLIELDKNTTAAINDYCSRLPFKVTPFRFALALLSAYLLRRYNCERIPVLTAYSGRKGLPENLKDTIGMLVNSLILDVSRNDEMTFADFLANVSSTLRSAMHHAYYPLNFVTEHLLGKGEDTSKIWNFSVVSNSRAHMPLAMEPVHENISPFALVFRVNKYKLDEDGLQTITIVYQTLAFTGREIEFMADGIKAMLSELLDNESKPVSFLSIIGDKEKKILLDDFKGAQLDYDKELTFVGAFRKTAVKYPSKTALKDKDSSMVYSRLDSLTDKAAVILGRDFDVRGRFVALMLPRKLEFMAAILAAMKAGAAYVPVDPDYPADRIEYMIKDSDAAVLITSKESGQKIAFGGRQLLIEDLLEKAESLTAYEQLKPPGVDDNAYMIYTSGSTGNPKGVVIPHRALSAFIAWNQRAFDLTEESKACVVSSFSFDASVIGLFPVLCFGGTLYIIEEKLRYDLGAFYNYAKQEGLTDAGVATQFGIELMNRYDLSLKNVMVGGEKLKAVPNFSGKLFNGYGPTEFTVASSYHIVDRSRTYDNIPIGAPIPNSINYIVDKNMQLVPLGMPGELCLSGVQIAAGYWSRDDLTQKVFVKNPYSAESGYEKMYRTGDLARWNEDGELEYLGRIDDQVKLRGFRIELGEIEACISGFDKIESVVAVVRGDLLCAYYCSVEEIDEKLLTDYLAKKLPEYMVPSGFMRLEKMPMTPGGKINKKALPQMEMKAEEIVPAGNELQKKILETVSAVIKNEQIGITTDLFFAGMSSLGAIRIAAIISKDTGISINARDIMNGKTVQAIEALILQGTAAVRKSYEKRDVYPLTQNQLGVYYACARRLDSTHYNVPIAFKFAASTDTAKLKQAFFDVIEAHSYVKTHLTVSGQQICQVRCDGLTFDVPVMKVQESAVAGIKHSFTSPFNLFEGPLFRACIYETDENVYLLTDFHHIVFDGFSVDILLRDLITAYGGKDVAKEEFTSFDVALMEEETGKSEVFAKAEEYFRQRLLTVDNPAVLPKDTAKDGEDGLLAKYSQLVPKALVDDFCRTIGITPSSLFLGAACFVISRFVNLRDILISTISNGRDDAGLQNNLGMMVKTLPFVNSVPSDSSIAAYLKNTQQYMFDTLTHKAYPFTFISRDYGFVPEIMYSYQAGLISEYSLDGKKVGLETLLFNEKAKFPVSIHVADSGADYKIELQYNDALYTADTMTSFAACIKHILESMTERSESLLKDLSIVTAEQSSMLSSFNREVKKNNVPSLHSMLEHQALINPDKTALIAADRTLSFREFNERANLIANCLLSLGVKKGDRIAFVLSRTSNILCCMLGIMKAGCAYIPIDPDYPADRINHVLDDSSARYTIVDSDRGFKNGLDVNSLLSGGKKDNPGVDVTSEDLCYIIYTSGSTGKPKGVMLTHGNIVNYVVPEKENRHVMALLDNGCTMLSITTVSFDMFLKEAFTTLMNGLTLVFADEEQAVSPQKLAELFEKTGANAFNATPSRMLQYLALPVLCDAIAKCKVVMAGGEKYPPALYNKLSAITRAVLINTYGPTEITVSSNAKLLTGINVSIGAPLHNVVEQVMDMDENPLPFGVVGELWIGGEGVAKGYFGNMAMTGERFVVRDGMRFYKSGDLAKWNNQGEIIVLGRNDGQIKLRGLRIELGEIETVLGNYRGIKSCAVCVKNIQGQEHICAYYTADRQLKIEELRENLLSSLAKYMVPTAYMQLDELPVTPNGKTDFKALPEPFLMSHQEYTEPETPAEKLFCDIFAKTIGVDRVGAIDNFFDLGGTSLLVTQVVIEAANSGYEVAYGDVFSYPTPRDLALLVDKKTEKSASGGNADAEFDYSAIDKLLQNNNLESYRNGEFADVGNICLTGATGFLGIHILREFLRSCSGAAYCVVRGGRVEAKERVKSFLVYYFSDDFDELFDKRIFVIDGDITDKSSFAKLEGLPIDTYINCAANVKHYAAGTEIEDINVGGVANGVEFCMKKGCRFIQISTTSVAGISIENNPPEKNLMTEQMHYFGQSLENKYIHSKFMAERIVLDAVTKGLNGKIMRVGNLMARSDDGEFQINFNTNSFVNRLRAFSIIGKVSYAGMGVKTEFAPIDCTAQAILKLSAAPRQCCIFHPYNDHDVFIGDIISELNKRGVAITPCEPEEYEKDLGIAMRDKEKSQQLSVLVAYSNMGRGKRAVPIKTMNSYTSQALLRLGFKWPITSDEYLRNFIDALLGFGFFAENE